MPMKRLQFKNSIKTDTEGAIESVRIKRGALEKM